MKFPKTLFLALSSSRSPSMRRMRQLLDFDSGRSAAAPSPVPTPSGTLPRGHRQLDINPAGDFLFGKTLLDMLNLFHYFRIFEI